MNETLPPDYEGAGSHFCLYSIRLTRGECIMCRKASLIAKRTRRASLGYGRIQYAV